MADPTPEDIQASYGFVASLAKQVPDINDLLIQATRDRWTPDRFVMSVANTNWYKSTTPAQREWITKMASDPAGAEADLKTGERTIFKDLTDLGLDVGKDGYQSRSDARMRELYIGAKVAGMDKDDNARRSWLFQQSVIGFSNEEAVSKFGGRYGQLTSQMFQLAKDYGYNSTDLTGEIVGQVNNIMLAGGTGDQTGWQRKMVDYAQRMYAPYAEDIRGGKTLTEVARPVRDRVSQLLEMNPDSLDTSDPIMKSALTEWSPQSTGGAARAYTLREIEDMARKDPRWDKTDNAMESATKMVNDIGTRFGMVK